MPKIAGWPGHYMNVRCGGGLSMVLLQLKDPLELFLKRREFPPIFLSHKQYDLRAIPFKNTWGGWNAHNFRPHPQ